MGKKEESERNVSIIGRVVFNKKDGLNITTEKDDYVIELDYIGKELLDFVDATIKATGFVTKYNGGITQIQIDDYEVFDKEDHVESEFDNRFRYLPDERC